MNFNLFFPLSEQNLANKKLTKQIDLQKFNLICWNYF
jgi:hypothetical protein